MEDFPLPIELSNMCEFNSGYIILFHWSTEYTHVTTNALWSWLL